MISKILATIDDYVSDRSKGHDTLKHRKKFAELLMDFIDFRIKSELKTQRFTAQDKAIDLLIKAPEPDSPNFNEEYKKWWQNRKEWLP
jgi:hypothetical protein